MKQNLQPLQEEILHILRRGQTSYAQPINSKEIGKRLNIAPSYIRRQLGMLVACGLVGVRRGSGGGYYTYSRGQDMEKLDAGQNQTKYLGDLKESLTDMRKYIPRLIHGLTRIAFILQTGEGKNAHGMLDQAMEGIDWYLKLLSAAQSILGINFNEYKTDDGQTVIQIIHSMKIRLETLWEAYKDKDLTLTADIIEYELIPILEPADNIIAKLINSVEKRLSS